MRMAGVVVLVALFGGFVGCGSDDPEPYSTEVRMGLQQGMLLVLEADPEALATFEDHGVSPHEVVRCAIREIEKRYSEEDFVLLSPAEVGTLAYESGLICGEKYRD